MSVVEEALITAARNWRADESVTAELRAAVDRYEQKMGWITSTERTFTDILLSIYKPAYNRYCMKTRDLSFTFNILIEDDGNIVISAQRVGPVTLAAWAVVLDHLGLRPKWWFMAAATDPKFADAVDRFRTALDESL